MPAALAPERSPPVPCALGWSGWRAREASYAPAAFACRARAEHGQSTGARAWPCLRHGGRGQRGEGARRATRLERARASFGGCTFAQNGPSESGGAIGAHIFLRVDGAIKGDQAVVRDDAAQHGQRHQVEQCDEVTPDGGGRRSLVAVRPVEEHLPYMGGGRAVMRVR
eukprot:5700153-Prymnesium_polylepis.1